MSKKEPVINHGLLHDSVNMKALIQAQSSQESFGGVPKEEKPKVKSLGKIKPIYKRTTHK